MSRASGYEEGSDRGGRRHQVDSGFFSQKTGAIGPIRPQCGRFGPTRRIWRADSPHQRPRPGPVPRPRPFPPWARHATRVSGVIRHTRHRAGNSTTLLIPLPITPPGCRDQLFEPMAGMGEHGGKRVHHGGAMADDGGKALCEPFVWARPAQDGSGLRSRASGLVAGAARQAAAWPWWPNHLV